MNARSPQEAGSLLADFWIEALHRTGASPGPSGSSPELEAMAERRARSRFASSSQVPIRREPA
ncbi:MAG TPA: hypothetical protein PLW10_15320, partial [Myxococcota bacterium]|nr:hypothetical protein [Myxococcota bacterium]